MTDDLAIPQGGDPLQGVPGRVAMRHTVALVDQAPQRPALARLFGATPLPAPARIAYREALGELEVAATLDGLGSEWRIIHSLPIGDSQSGVVDHLAIGPAGVFVIDTSVHPGAVVVADQRAFTVADVRLPSIRSMEFEMGRVERLLGAAIGRPLEVAGVLAVVEPRSLTVTAPHRDVAVVQSTEMASWLRARPRVLGAERIEEIARAAERPETWSGDDAIADPDVDGVRDRFAAVRRRVEGAARVQRLWLIAVAVAVTAGILAASYAIFVGAITVAP